MNMMNMEFRREMPTANVVQEMYPLSGEMAEQKRKNDAEIRAIFEGKSHKLLLVIGPCSADREDAVIEYITRLRGLQEKVKDVITMGYVVLYFGAHSFAIRILSRTVSAGIR